MAASGGTAGGGASAGGTGAGGSGGGRGGASTTTGGTSSGGSGNQAGAAGAGGTGGKQTGPCSDPSECASNHCDSGQCRPTHCYDALMDQGESDKDCGGQCQPCAVGAKCNQSSDCATQTCQANLCRATVKVSCKCVSCGTSASVLDATFQIVNLTSQSIDLQNYTVHYYFTSDGNSNLSATCAEGNITGGCMNISSSISSISPAQQMADSELVIAFGASPLTANNTTGLIQLNISAPSNPFDQSNDYSAVGRSSATADCLHMTLYKGNALLWGTPPP